ncbi:MAG: permease-like cell division protein FtsX [Chitinophagaceae bacterium]|nr:permease-like cell division protein FtsX [Chitinophagaceae bacterium]
MTQEQSKASMKRSKPSYIAAITGVAIVLFILGILGWIFLNFQQMGSGLKEEIKMYAWLSTTNKKSIDSLTTYVAGQPYIKSYTYVDKDKAREIYNKENQEDFDKILQQNPLPPSIEFFAKSSYVNKDSLSIISADLLAKFPGIISEVQYPKEVVTIINERSRTIGVVTLIIGIILSIIVIISIDNTIRLAMFSNRFLIKTMQMVGATQSFIARPMNIRAVINGLISSAIAIAAVWAVITWMESLVPALKTLRSFKMYLFLFGGILIIGVGISLYSTHRSVLKYLKMKLDELY